MGSTKNVMGITYAIRIYCNNTICRAAKKQILMKLFTL